MLITLDKPAGCTTHNSFSPSTVPDYRQIQEDGFIEYVSRKSKKNLLPIHRLDVETTGLLLAWIHNQNQEDPTLKSSCANPLALPQLSHSEIGKLFENHKIHKTYLFITDKKGPQRAIKQDDMQDLIVRSHIERLTKADKIKEAGSRYVSLPGSLGKPENAVTSFRKLKEQSGFSLWQAIPLSGKPHQIRLHASDLGIPLLGDTEHGGTKFPTLCLHAQRLSFSSETTDYSESSPAPVWFENLELLKDPTLIAWLAGFDRRLRLNNSLTKLGVPICPTQRQLHAESQKGGSDLRIDKLGKVTQFHLYSEPTSENIHRIKKLAAIHVIRDWWIQLHTNRGSGTTNESKILSRPELPDTWLAAEEETRYVFSHNRGFSSGLFLDQRANRKWVKNLRAKKVLNLFAYTGGFSVVAAQSGASHVVTVDLSKPFLKWAKENFAANDLDASNPQYEFRAIDSREYLSWAKRKNLSFDLIVCDPPSFSRSKQGIFRIESELVQIVRDCLSLLEKDGRLLVSTNFENWNDEDFVNKIDDAIFNRSAYQIEAPALPDWDFEFPRESRKMKSLVIHRLTN